MQNSWHIYNTSSSIKVVIEEFTNTSDSIKSPKMIETKKRQKVTALGKALSYFFL